MAFLVIIGGRNDGETYELQTGEDKISMAEYLPIEHPIEAIRSGAVPLNHYRRLTIFSREGASDVLVPAGQNYAETIKMLIEKYPRRQK